MDYKITSIHLGAMAFEADIDGHKVINDTTEANGGRNTGASPKKMLLQTLAACSGMDVSSLLKKMHIEYSDFKIEVSANLTEDHPKVFSQINMVYSLKTNEGNRKKVEKAVNLSQDKYCGISAMLGKSSSISFEIIYL